MKGQRDAKTNQYVLLVFYALSHFGHQGEPSSLDRQPHLKLFMNSCWPGKKARMNHIISVSACRSTIRNKHSLRGQLGSFPALTPAPRRPFHPSPWRKAAMSGSTVGTFFDDFKASCKKNLSDVEDCC